VALGAVAEKVLPPDRLIRARGIRIPFGKIPVEVVQSVLPFLCSRKKKAREQT
jgi:hypothetical protein